MSFHKCFHTSSRSEKLCVQGPVVPAAAYLFWTHILQEHSVQQEAIPAGRPFPSASLGSPS